ncbi:MAG: cell wall-binding repeat-containing protein [Dermatophilaceae bacterium]
MRHITGDRSTPRARRALATTGAIALVVGGLLATGAGSAGAATSAGGSTGSRALMQVPAPGADAVKAGGAAGRSALGNHTLTVVPVYWSGSAPAPLDAAALGTTVRDTSSYLRAATASRITASLGPVKPWTAITLTATEQSTCDVAAIERQVRAVVPAPTGGNQHLEIVFAPTSACQFGTLAQRGLSTYGDGVAFFNGPTAMTPATLGFGIGSNAGLGMANSIDCWDDAQHSNPVPQSGYCKEQIGGDPWDLMGAAPYGAVGMPSAANLRRLGVFGDADFPELIPGQSQYPFIRPLTSYTGQRGFAVTLGRHRYTVEYRTVAGLDSWIDDATWTDPIGILRTDPGGGVIVRYQDLDSDTPWNTTVLDFHPDAPVSTRERHPGMEAGESWASPGNLLRLEVVSTTSSGASIRVDFPGLNKVERWSGADRYATSAAISVKSFSPGVPVAYVASGAVYADALSGAPVAGKDKGPILLVTSDRIPGSVQTELRRLTPGKIVVLGGPATVNDEVLSKLQDYTAGGVERWSGLDRFETSAAISAKSFAPGVATAFIASGRIYTDALSGAPVAGKNASPVLLVDSSSVPARIQAELTRLKPGRIVVLGGPTTVTPNVLTKLQTFTTGAVVRWSGPDRFATSAEISAGNYGPGVAVLYVASGRVFSDALPGAPVAGMTRGPVLLVDTFELPRTVENEIARLQPHRIVILGGPATVSENVRAALGSFLP